MERCMLCEQPVGAPHLEICPVDGRLDLPRHLRATAERPPVLAGSWTFTRWTPEDVQTLLAMGAA